ncbi:hypothetical protein O181_005811 [Austropuccinia psidii MF-1]|uniref:Uncharacterized protein n=1 Tax=Austropuccinia psidii MF-1 TaxID=1389203 RepID=A0A9Q3BHZ5_9BASI|nr:hypothetical protein [Austropuccinia psidii MF-1]
MISVPTALILWRHPLTPLLIQFFSPNNPPSITCHTTQITISHLLQQVLFHIFLHNGLPFITGKHTSLAPQTLTLDLHFQVKNLVQDIYNVAVQEESLVDMISLGNDSHTSEQYDPYEDNYMKAASGSFSDGNSLATAPSKTIKK